MISFSKAAAFLREAAEAQRLFDDETRVSARKDVENGSAPVIRRLTRRCSAAAADALVGLRDPLSDKVESRR